MKTLLVAASLSLVACVDSTESTADLTCLGPKPIAALHGPTSGVVLDEIGGAGVPNALIEVRSRADQRVFASTGTDAHGEYTMLLAADAPAFSKLTAEGYLDGYGFDSSHVPGEHAHQMMLTAAGSDELYRSAGVMRDLTKATVLVVVEDCTGRPVRGATISADAERVMYLGDDTQFDPALDATSGDSAALILNAPVGALDITVDAGIEYSTWPIETSPGAFSVSWRRP